LPYRAAQSEEVVNVNLCPPAAVIALLSVGLTAPQISRAQASPAGPGQASQVESAVPGLHDFDFLAGRWKVHHRKLTKRLVNSHDWVEFDGTLFSQPLMGGYANVDDDVFDVPGGAYRGVAPRSFDPKSRQWSIWWMDSRTPTAPMDPPVKGSFHNGVGTFYADDTENGRPIRIRFIWSKITPTSCHWEQAFSPDGGKTWETNWLQDLVRVQ
jgi:hypothetical protein